MFLWVEIVRPRNCVSVLQISCELCGENMQRSEIEEVMGTIFPRATLIYVPVVKKAAIEKVKRGQDVSSKLTRG